MSMVLLPLLATFYAQALFGAGVALLTFFLLRRFFRLERRRRAGSDRVIDAQPRPNSTWSGAYQDADAKLSRQEVELHERARDAAGQIDSKMIVLQELIARSQQQIERLETLLDEQDHAPRSERKEASR